MVAPWQFAVSRIPNLLLRLRLSLMDCTNQRNRDGQQRSCFGGCHITATQTDTGIARTATPNESVAAFARPTHRPTN